MSKSETIATKRRTRKPSKKAQAIMEAAGVVPREEEASPVVLTVGTTVAATPAYEVVVPFTERIKMFNEMYGVESNDYPVNLGAPRVEEFHDILKEEMTEYNPIITKLDAAKRFARLNKTVEAEAAELAALTELGDWLGDIQVYCASEARRWGLNNDAILQIIMDSNASKLGEDGKPIIDSRGKIKKGPNYWDPASKITLLVRNKIMEWKALRGKK